MNVRVRPSTLPIMRRAAEAVPVAYDLAAEFAAIVGERNCLTHPSELRTYECDGLTGLRVRPLAVVLPATTAQVSAVVRAAEAHVRLLPTGPRSSAQGAMRARL